MHAEPIPSALTPPRHGISVHRLSVLGYAVVYAAWLVVGVVDVLVWSPQQTAPAVPLDRIYSVLAGNGSLVGVVAEPLLWAFVWAVLGAVLVVVALPAHASFRLVTAQIPRVTAVGIAMVVFGAMAFFQWWSGFAMGNEVSDDLPPGAGTTTAFSATSILGGTLLVLVGALVAVVGLVHAARARRRRASA